MSRFGSNKILWLVIALAVAGSWWWKGGVGSGAEKVQGARQEKKVDLDEDTSDQVTLAQGCPVRDCLPAIDEPKFEAAEMADSWLADDDIVLGLDYRGVHRAYPQQILNWHEVVNDEAVGEKLAITFSPLSGAAAAFKSRVGEQELEFGLSGKLYESNSVLYDRQSESLWQQLTGAAIGGEYFGISLERIPIETLTWKEWKQTHPATEVLSRKTGYLRDYDRHPYGTYEEDTTVYFPVAGGVDETLHPKTVVYGLVHNEAAKAYTLPAIKRETGPDSVLTDTVGGAKVRLSLSNGEVFVENLTTHSEMVPVRVFWFVWKAFYPDTELHE